MKLGQNPWMIICLVAAIMTLSLLSVSVAQDQNLPEGKDKGVWVLIDTKPDVEAEKDWDNGAYYNNHVSLSGSTIEGGYSWKDGDDPDDCKGTVKGKVSWTELPGVLEPGVKQETTITAEASGKQSCSARHPGACAHLEINEVSLEPHPCISFNSGDLGQDSKTEKVSWEAPWGNKGDNLTITVNNRVSGSLPAYVYYIYSYKAERTDTRSSKTFDPGSLEPRTGFYLKFVKGDVYVVRDGEQIPAKNGFQLREGDFIEVPNHSDASIYREGEFRLILQPGSKLYIDKDAEDIKSEERLQEMLSRPAAEIGLLLYGGRLFFDSDKEQRERKEDREAELIGMRWGTAESEHTLYVCEQTSDASILKVLDGAVKFTSNVTGEEILVNAGQMATATASGLSPLESFDVEAENASWEPYLPTIEVTEPEEEAIGGIWYMGGPINEGMPCQIVQEGDTLTVINENGQQSSGRFVDSSTIEATDWENGLRGTLSVDRNRIDWANGSWWIRNNSAGGAFSRDKTNGEVIGTSEDYRVSPKASTEEIGSAEVVQSDIPKATFIDRICGWAGTWESNFGQMVLQQSGNSITGTYVHDQGRIRGTISGKKVVGTWSESPSYNSPNDAGDFEFTISDNCGSFSGNWRYGSTGGWSGGWSGTRI